MTRVRGQQHYSRRQLLSSAALLLPVVAWPNLLRAAAALDLGEPTTVSPGSRAALPQNLAKTATRRLAFRHTHTGETLDVVFSEGGKYVAEALTRIDQLCRDFRSGESHRMDPSLLDLLYEVQHLIGHRGSFEIISAYRSEATNRMLADTRGGVAKGSRHLTGQAMDVRLPGVPTAELRRIALQYAGGGVGYYPASDFVHLDTGPVRSW